jgi:hypothetical protein
MGIMNSELSWTFGTLERWNIIYDIKSDIALYISEGGRLLGLKTLVNINPTLGLNFGSFLNHT